MYVIIFYVFTAINGVDQYVETEREYFPDVASCAVRHNYVKAFNPYTSGCWEISKLK